MTKEEALKVLDTIPTIGEQVDALEIAIEALEQEPCEDCISRAEALMAIDFAWSENDDWDFRLNIERRIKKLPAVQPARPEGEWIPMQVSSGRDSWKCSICGRRARGKLINLPFCHCGADMRGDKDDE